MKKLLLFSIAVFISVFFYSFTIENVKVRTTIVSTDGQYYVPDDIQSIIDKSCFECHNSDGRTAGKMKLKFDEMSILKEGKQVNKLLKIIKVVENDKMPPKKFSENYPDKELTQEDSERLIKWAKETALMLSGE